MNPDIVELVANRPNPPFCVGFAAESEKLEERAEAKRRRKKLPLLAANLLQSAIGADDNELVLFDDDGSYRLGRTSKLEQARKLIRHIGKMYQPRKAAIPPESRKKCRCATSTSRFWMRVCAPSRRPMQLPAPPGWIFAPVSTRPSFCSPDRPN
jgi:hypothetical protein